ncbi:hypothetical protein [Streptomyces spiramyceticus]|uniref:hypothetical protein n=1 Tax=Streptomyces spiramyceticus TaxID=299717 RepID=UPI00237AE258|nr:hypothetical protein [Streptomyces spiramyceticus]
MHGSGSAPPVRSDGVVITMRVLFAVGAVFSCGMLSCVPLFRIAILRGRRFDWALAWLSLPVAIAGFAVVGTLPEGDVRTDIALACILLLGAASAGYFLTFDIRYYARLQATGAPYTPPAPRVPYGPYAAPAAAPPHYGYPNPYANTPATNPAPVQQPQPPQQQPPHRMDQVRAELDELSDLLRKDQRGDQDR